MRSLLLGIAFAAMGCSTTAATEPDAAADSSLEYPAAPAPPDGGYPYCYGPSIPEAGPCCSNFFCFDPPDAGGLCPSVGDPSVHQAAGMLGGCSCTGSSGPYAPPDGGTGCCYVWNARGCM